MGNQQDDKALVRARQVRQFATFVSILLGSSVLTGWIFNLPTLKSVLPNLATMKANTALCFILSGIALANLKDDKARVQKRRIGFVCAALVAVIGLSVCTEYLFGIDLRIDQLLFRDTAGTSGIGFPGRMSPATALIFFCIGLSLLLLDRALLSQLLSLVAIGLGSLALIGYAYGVSSLYRIGPYSSMAIHTASGFVILGAGLLHARPDQALMAEITDSHFGGMMARRFLIVCLFLPPVFGWIRLKAEHAGLVDTPFGLALVILSTITSLTILIWFNARSLNRIDAGLRHASDIQRDILAAIPTSIALLNNEGKILAVNHAWKRYAEEHTTRSSDYQVGHNYLSNSEGLTGEFSDPKLEAATAVKAILKGEKDIFSLEYPYQNQKSGQPLWFEMVVAPLNNEGPRGALIMHVNVTERKHAEEALQDSERRFRATFEQAAVGIAHVGLDGQWLQVNQRLCDIVGYQREELLQCTFQDITYPDDLPTDLINVQQLLAGQILTYSMEKRYLHKKGTVVWINLTASLVREPSGRPNYFIAVIEDITQRKQLEEQLFQSQKMEGIGSLAGGVAHDFNNLLTAIQGYTGLAIETISETKEEDKDTIGFLQNVMTASDRAAGLTRQLLAFARRQIMEPRVLDLNSLVMNLNNMLRRLIGEDIEVVVITTPDIWAVNVDPGQMEQVITNLAVNARDAMPDGGKLTIETANITLDETYVRQHLATTPGDYVMLAVSDTGTGMTPEVQARIFEPFFTTKAVGKGTGLGMATCYGIVKQFGGNIWVYSEPGQGTTLKIYLPRVDAPVESVSIPDDAQQLPGGTETILVVEDEQLVRNIVVTALRFQGYTVLEASTGSEALKIAEEYPETIHLVLTDVVMPHMGGRRLIEQFQSMRPGMKALYMSGYTNNAIVHHGVLDSGIHFLQKPFTNEVLLRKVREALDSE